MPQGQDLEAQSGAQEDAQDAPPGPAGNGSMDELLPMEEAEEVPSPVLPVTGDVSITIDPSALPPLLPAGPAREQPPFEPKTAAEAAKWEKVITEYEREAAALGNESRAAHLYLEIGRIFEEQLAKPRNAATSYQRAFNLNPRSLDILHASRRLFTEVGNWAMVVQILGYEIECAESIERKATLYAEKGTILEEKLKNVEEAQKAFREALKTWSAEPLAINALERMHLFRKEYQPLYDVYVRALSATSRPERRLPLLVAAAQLAEDRLDNLEGAVAHYREILDADPTNAVALAALRRLTLQTGNHEELVASLTLSAKATSDPEEAATCLLTAARIQHEKLGQTDKALHSLLGSLEHTPENLAVLREIEHLYAANQRPDEVVKVLRREVEVTSEVRDRVPILVKLATVLEDDLDQPDEAIPPLEEAVKLMPDYVPAKQALGRLYTRREKWEPLAKLFELEAEHDEDKAVAAEKLFKLAEIQETRLGRTDEAIQTLEKILVLRPDYQPARKLLEHLLQSKERWQGLIDLYDQEVGLLGEHDRDQKVFLLGRIGLFAEDKLQALDVAATAFQRILDLVPGHLHAIRTLARLAEKRGVWAEVVRLLDLEVEATADQKEVVSILHRAAQITEEKLQDRDTAVALYEKVLTLSPTYLPALKSLGRIYHQQGRWHDLLTMYQREIEVSKSTDRTVGLLFRMADIFLQRLADDARAIDVFEQILAKDGKSLPALRALAEIHARHGSHEKLVEVLTRESQQLDDPRERANVLMRVAELFEEKLDRADNAAEVYQEILRLEHNFDAAIRSLVRIYSAEGMWNALSRALKTAYDHAKSNEARGAILVRCAEVAGDKLGNLDSAAENLELALELRPTDVTILSQLERVSVARRDWRRAIAVAEKVAEHEADPRLFAARQIRIATMKETQLEPPESGAEHYRRALEKVPNHPVALRALELAYLRAANWPGLSAFYQREALVTRDPDQKGTLFARAADVAEHRVGDAARAFDLYAQALDASPRYLPAIRGRKRLAERLGQASVALDCIRAEGEATADPIHARELLFEAGQLYQDQFKDVPQAVATYEKVLEVAPDHLAAFNRLEAIYLELESWAPMLALLETRAKALGEPLEQAKLYVAAGQIAQDRIGDKDRALALYREVLSRDPMHHVGLVRTGPLLFERQDWDAAIDVFHKTLAVTKEPKVLLVALKSLAIIYQEHRQDLVKCVQSFQAALQANPGDVESLDRLAKVYQEAQDWGSAINVLLRLAEVHESPKKKVETLLQLAHIYQTGGQDRRNAILANRKALEIEPTNQTAILRLSDLYEVEQDWQSLADVTAAYVRLLPRDQKDKAGPLHLKMADVFETKLGDDARAINALKYALEAQPNNLAALERLALLYSKKPETFAQAVDVHRRLLAADPFRVDSYRAMFRMFTKSKQIDRAFVVAEILVFLRLRQGEEELFHDEHKSKVLAYGEGVFDHESHERLITHPGERGPIRSVLEILSGELNKIYPGNMARYEFGKNDRFGPKSDHPLRTTANRIARVLGAPEFDLWVTRKLEMGLFLENEKPLALIVGSSVDRIQDKDQRFLLGRQLERLRGGHHLVDIVPAKELEALLWTVAKIANPGAQVPIDPATLDAMQRKLAKALSSRARKLLEDVGRHLTSAHIDVAKHRAFGVLTANRAGLAVANDIEVAVRNIARDYPDVRPVFADARGAAETIGKIPEVRDVLTYAVSEEYFAARALLGIAIKG
jgi:tetratricopeptide (TPR) repeat protein